MRALKKQLKAAEDHIEVINYMNIHRRMLITNNQQDSLESAKTLYSIAEAWSNL